MFSRLWIGLEPKSVDFLQPDQGTAFVKLCSGVGLFKAYPDFKAEFGICCDNAKERGKVNLRQIR